MICDSHLTFTLGGQDEKARINYFGGRVPFRDCWYRVGTVVWRRLSRRPVLPRSIANDTMMMTTDIVVAGTTAGPGTWTVTDAFVRGASPYRTASANDIAGIKGPFL